MMAGLSLRGRLVLGAILWTVGLFAVTGSVLTWLMFRPPQSPSMLHNLFMHTLLTSMVALACMIAGLWQGTGLVMCLMLAGLRGIDEDIWKAARVDGIPMWKTYLFVVIPMMRPVFITTLVLITAGIVKLYDLVVAQTGGGPGIASEVPARTGDDDPRYAPMPTHTANATRGRRPTGRESRRSAAAVRALSGAGRDRR